MLESREKMQTTDTERLAELCAGAQPWDDEERRKLRNTALQCLTRHDHDFRFRSKADANLCRANCGACVLNGYRDRDDDEHDPKSGPNYAGWARIYVEARRMIPRKWTAAFLAEFSRTDNLAYVEALRRDVASFGADLERRA